MIVNRGNASLLNGKHCKRNVKRKTNNKRAGKA